MQGQAGKGAAVRLNGPAMCRSCPSWLHLTSTLLSTPPLLLFHGGK